MHLCQRLARPTKQFWNWLCGMAFRAVVGITTDVINVIKIFFFSIFPLTSETEKVIGG
jgi:hypothetical protein